MLQIDLALTRGGPGLSPLDCLAGRRLNLLALCTVLDALPSRGIALARLLAPGIAGYLTHDFAALATEEEDELLPRLASRLLLGDDLDELVDQLRDEHRRDLAAAHALAVQCRNFAEGEDEEWPELSDSLVNFAERQRRHLLWEDATIITMARQRLIAEDYADWKRSAGGCYRISTSPDGYPK